MFLYLLSWVSMVLQAVFITLSLAAGLYYIAEAVEEYSVMTAKIIRYMIYVTLVVNVGLFLIEGMPLYLTGLLFLTNLDHLLLLGDFPNLNPISPPFLIAVLMVFVNHYLAFSYFANVHYEFSEVVAYFTICLWIVPFAFFVSLSINESTLPTTNTMSMANPTESMFTRNKRSGILGAFDYVSEKKDLLKENLFGRNHMY